MRKYVTLDYIFKRFAGKSLCNAIKSQSNTVKLQSNAPELLCNAPWQATYGLKYVTCVGITRTYEPMFASYT